jgi:hypothetical protein
MSISGAFCYAVGNIMQEYFLKTRRDIYHYIGFLGFFGLIIGFIESVILGEFQQFSNALHNLHE